MKMTLVLSALVAFIGCQRTKSPVGVLGGDSPIIVSDSSPTTHLKHKGAARDFHISESAGSIVLTIADGYTVGNLDCKAGFSCSSTPLAKNWTLTAYDGHSGSGTMIFTMTSADNMTIVTTFNANITDLDSKIDGTTDTNGGTDLIQSEHELESVALTNNGSSTTLDCPQTPCKLKINYQ